MTLLPIVGRELRVAARKRSTFWLRIVAALVALVISSGVMIILHVSRMPSANVGGALFATLTWLSLGAALSAGLFFTSDCLSEEKREGTLGFLFLTDLRGYDVVAGKLLATSLRCSYALLAIFPILAITLLIGGVTGAQFSKTLLALANALFCSLAAGMFVSALSRDSQKAMMATLLLVLVLAAGGPVADAILDDIQGRPTGPLFSLSSAFFVFRIADSWGTTPYWQALFISQGIAWVLLVFACVLVPRTWQEKGRRKRVAQDRAYSWRYGGRRRRRALRRKLLEANPVMWLACREQWQALTIWTVAIVMLCGFVYLASSSWSYAQLIGWQPLSWIAMLVIYLWLASHATRFFVDARRSGIIELLLVSPVDSAAIVRGQWRALLRMFALPVLIIVCAQLASSVLIHYALISGSAAMATTTTVVTISNGTSATVITTARGKNKFTNSTSTSFGGTNATNSGTNSSNTFTASAPSPSRGQQTAVIVTTAITGAVTSLANLIALCWFGMWMGMTSKSNNLATLKTIAFVQVVPLLVSYFISGILMMLVMLPFFAGSVRSGKSSNNSWLNSIAVWMPFLYTGLVAIFCLGKDIGFTLWARKKLRLSFREQAARGIVPIRFAPPLLPPPIAPPVVAAQK